MKAHKIHFSDILIFLSDLAFFLKNFGCLMLFCGLIGELYFKQLFVGNLPDFDFLRLASLLMGSY